MVCMGNICRSPTAEGVLRSVAGREFPTLEIVVDSAGTHDDHVGDPPDLRAQRAAARRGIDIGGLRARQLCVADFDRFDHLLVMDARNERDVAALAPPVYRARIERLMRYAPSAGDTEVPDPYYDNERAFEQVLDLVEVAARGFLSALQARR
jgi:protein-tyrosine phosphatase